jgi:hypothetical protein
MWTPNDAIERLAAQADRNLSGDGAGDLVAMAIRVSLR